MNDKDALSQMEARQKDIERQRLASIVRNPKGERNLKLLSELPGLNVHDSVVFRDKHGDLVSLVFFARLKVGQTELLNGQSVVVLLTIWESGKERCALETVTWTGEKFLLQDGKNIAEVLMSGQFNW